MCTYEQLCYHLSYHQVISVITTYVILIYNLLLKSYHQKPSTLQVVCGGVLFTV